jgi:hypothetical protein
MALGHTNIPEFINGLSNPAAWINGVLSLLSNSVLATTAEVIFTRPTSPIPGKVYLISSPQTGTSPGTSGDIVIYTTSNPLSGSSLSMPDGTTIGCFTKNGTNWGRNTFAPMSTVLISTNQTVPATFDGTCILIVKSAGFTVTGAIGRTNLGLAGTILPIGVYFCYQDSTDCVIN